MQISVPGMYQNPAPYREQTFTYSTGLAFTGRSAACAPDIATRPAADARKALFTIFIFVPPCLLPVGGFGLPEHCPWKVPLSPREPPRNPNRTRDPRRDDLGKPPSVAQSP